MAGRRPPVSELSCFCRCHIDEEQGATGVSRLDPVAAAAACPLCLWAHCKALLEPREPRPRRDPPDPGAWRDSE